MPILPFWRYYYLISTLRLLETFPQPQISLLFAACRCNANGSFSEICHARTGQCECRPNVQGRRCDECKVRSRSWPINYFLLENVNELSGKYTLVYCKKGSCNSTCKTLWSLKWFLKIKQNFLYTWPSTYISLAVSLCNIHCTSDVSETNKIQIKSQSMESKILFPLPLHFWQNKMCHTLCFDQTLCSCSS